MKKHVNIKKYFYLSHFLGIQCLKPQQNTFSFNLNDRQKNLCGRYFRMTDKTIGERYTNWIKISCFTLNEDCGIEVECDNEDYCDHQDEVAGSWKYVFLVYQKEKNVVHAHINPRPREVSPYTHTQLLAMMVVQVAHSKLQSKIRRLRFETKDDDLYIIVNNAPFNWAFGVKV